MNKKTALYIGGGILLLGVGFFIYKKRKGKANYDMGNLPNKSGQGSSYTSNSSNSSSSSNSSNSSNSFNPKPHAEALKEAMAGFGTDDTKFFDTSNSLSKSERREVRTYFETNIGDLEDWIEGDFSFGDEKKALKLYGY
tara:strand:+ start:3647 stop:4063 length:417 start_codon:yes stop_codon:yes gene_type:complete